MDKAHFISKTGAILQEYGSIIFYANKYEIKI